jgi:hypothetical protein
MRTQSLFNRTYTNMRDSLQTATCSNHEIKHDTRLCSERTPLRIKQLRPTECHQMAGDDTSQNAVSRMCRWYTNDTYNWGIRGNYITGHRAPMLRSGSFHCWSKHVCVCVCVCERERERVREWVREIWEKETERERGVLICVSVPYDQSHCRTAGSTSSDITGL